MTGGFPKPAAQERSALLLAGALLAAALVLFVLVAGLVIERLQASRAEIASFRSDLDRLETLKERLASLETGSDGTLFMKAETSAQAVAAFQDLLTRLAVSNRAELVSIEAKGGETVHGLERLRFKVMLTAPVESLEGLLAALDTSRPIILQDKVTIRTQTIFQRFSTDAPETAGERLQLALELSAFRSPTGTPS